MKKLYEKKDWAYVAVCRICGAPKAATPTDVSTLIYVPSPEPCVNCAKKFDPEKVALA